MSRLAERQRRFIAAVHGEAPAEDGLRPYRQGALAAWREALGATFPVVRRLVGAAFFREASDRYAAAHPSTRGDLHRYGESFPVFIASYEPARPLPYLGDMARLEWALHEAGFAAEAAPFDFASLGEVPAHSHGQIVLLPHPAARSVETSWPLAAWWRANQPDRDGTPEAAAPTGRGVLVTRGDGLPLPHCVDDPEWRVFQGCAAGEPLERVADALGDQASALPGAIARLAECHAFGGFRLAA